MKSKKILVEKSERGILKTALSHPGNEKLDILSFVMAGTSASIVDPTAYCDTRAFADQTYVKRT
jgi:hypothetical protein